MVFTRAEVSNETYLATVIPRRRKQLQSTFGEKAHTHLLRAAAVDPCNLRGHPYMTSALRGEGGSPKEDVVREVA